MSKKKTFKTDYGKKDKKGDREDLLGLESEDDSLGEDDEDDDSLKSDINTVELNQENEGDNYTEKAEFGDAVKTYRSQLKKNLKRGNTKFQRQ